MESEYFKEHVGNAIGETKDLLIESLSVNATILKSSIIFTIICDKWKCRVSALSDI